MIKLLTIGLLAYYGKESKMKMRETNSGKLNLTMSKDESEVIYGIMNHVRLGSGGNSDVVLELLELFQNYIPEPDIDITCDNFAGEGWTINV